MEGRTRRVVAAQEVRRRAFDLRCSIIETPLFPSSRPRCGDSLFFIIPEQLPSLDISREWPCFVGVTIFNEQRFSPSPGSPREGWGGGVASGRYRLPHLDPPPEYQGRKEEGGFPTFLLPRPMCPMSVQLIVAFPSATTRVQ